MEKKDISVGTVGCHEVNRLHKDIICVERGDISAETVFPIQTAQAIAAEGVGMGVADFEVEVVEEGVWAEDKTRVEEALVALIHQKRGQVQPRKKKKKRKNHHRRVQ